MDERGSRENFTRTGTLGIEEEYFVVDAQGRPTSGTDELVYGSEPPLGVDDEVLFLYPERAGPGEVLA